MVKHGRALWDAHPHVGNELSVGERAADRLKSTFGSWSFLVALNGFIVGWVVLNAVLGAGAFDPFPFILLNLGLSWLAAQQGGALQIAANRGDRLNAEVALHTQTNTDRLLAINEQQLEILTELRELRAAVEGKDGGGENAH